jgi:TonB-linked SusC/RagA family outer membrane protein
MNEKKTEFRKTRVMFAIFTLLLFSVMFANAQQLVSGIVKDTHGEPVIGANVIEKGTTNGSITDIDGKFSFQVSRPNTVLEVTYIGYKPVNYNYKGEKFVNIVIEENTEKLDEVVVVGYGTQKRVNLSGAVEQVTSEVFDNRPMANISQGLQGAIPNLNISLSDGKPVRSSDFNVRGTTSIGQGGSALVLIDGVEGDPSMLNPNDIASVSVLKDASSAAIYGARGAFGVVLITTKNPNKERTSVTYSGNFSFKKPTVVPDIVTDGNLYTDMYVEAYSAFYDYARTPSAIHKGIVYTSDWHNELKNHTQGSGLDEVLVGSNGKYQYYGNTDWYDLLYKNNTFGQDHNVTVQGGGEKADMMVSARYYGQDGIFNYNSDDYKMFNVRAKGSAQLYKWLKIENNFEFNQMQYHNPLTVADGNVWYGIEGEGHPVNTMFNPDGTLTQAAAYCVGDLWYGKSGTDLTKRVLRNTTGFTASFLDDKLKVKGDITFRYTDEGNVTKRVAVPYSDAPGVISYLGSSTNDYTKSDALTKYLATNIYAEYSHTFGKLHDLVGMIGYNYEQSIYDYSSMTRNGLIFEDAENISMTNGTGMTIDGDYNKWRIAGGFFRFNYDYADRYLLEVNGRLDGSSKFPTNQQWGFFPSVSGAWRMSEEAFWHVNPKIISDAKIRVSYGSLGNGNVDPYSYQELFTIYQMARLINGQKNQATSLPTIMPDGLTWETSTTANFGLDFGSANGKLRFSGDYYVRKTKDMFTVGTTLPAVFGADSPKGNYADMTTKGWELSLTWRDDFKLASKPLSYDLRFTLSDYTSKIDKYNNATKYLGGYNDARCNYYEGMTVGEIWGYVTEGFFTSEEDIANHADQSLFFASNSGTWLPGDIKFKDLNGDGKIDYGSNCVGDSGDKKVIGNTTPRYTYSISANVDWNGIFVSAFFQGVGKQDWWPGTDNGLFWGQYCRPYSNIPTSMIGNIWSEDNPDAYFPRYRGYVALQGTRELSVVQTRYLQNVAYIRLKNLQVGYNFPKAWVNKAKMQSARIYVSAENLCSWSPLYKHTKNIDVASIYGEDTEAKASASNNSIISNGGQSYSYPLLKSISLGLSVTF